MNISNSAEQIDSNSCTVREGEAMPLSVPQEHVRGGSDIPLERVSNVHSSHDFAALRRRSRIFTFTVGGLVLGWFLLLFVAVGYLPSLMAYTVGGHFNLGLLFAWSQVVSTVVVAVLFVRHVRANRNATHELRCRLNEGSGQ